MMMMIRVVIVKQNITVVINFDYVAERSNGNCIILYVNVIKFVLFDGDEMKLFLFNIIKKMFRVLCNMFVKSVCCFCIFFMLL